MTAQERSNVNTIERMVAAYNRAAARDLSVEETLARTLQVFDEFYAPDLRWFEAPTPFFPEGRTGGRPEITAAVQQVSALLRERRYTVVDVFAAADRVASEYVWEATYRDSGRTLRIRMATLYRMRDGQFVQVHEYPCMDSAAST